MKKKNKIKNEKSKTIRPNAYYYANNEHLKWKVPTQYCRVNVPGVISMSASVKICAMNQI